MSVILNQQQIDTIQKMRYEGASNDQIKEAVPFATDSLIGTYAPSELRGGKRRLAEYLANNPGVDFRNINFRAIDVDPNSAANQIYSLRRAGLVTFKQGKIALMKGDHHTANGSSEKGMYDITLTPMGVRRVEASRLIAQVAAESSEPHAAIAEKVSGKGKKSKDSPVAGQTEAFRLLPPDVLAARVIDLNPSGFPIESDHIPGPTIDFVEPGVVHAFDDEIAEENQAIALIQTQAELMGVVAQKYPILTELRKRAGRIHAANRLVDQALNLYDSADLTSEAIALLEHLKKTEVKYTPIESELLSLAEDMGI